MQNGLNWCNLLQVCAIKSNRNFSQRTHMINPIGFYPHVLVHFIVFGCIWDRFRNYMKLDAKQGELVQLMRKFLPRCHVRIFSTNAPNPPHWTLNSCFGELHSVWMHLGSFRNCRKLDAKQCELVQLMHKLVPRSHVEIFCNERTQSTPLDPKLMFWCVA